MEKCYSYIKRTTLDQMSINGTSVKYGKQEDVVGYWKIIIECDDENDRHLLIDDLLKKMQNNAAQNGFWKPEDEIRISFGIGTTAIHLDDTSIYYSFFDNLRMLYQHNQTESKPVDDGVVALSSIFRTIEQYFGSYNGNLALRGKLTALNPETCEYPSISILKGKGCGACVEKAAVAHNLWLLMGRESYYVASTSAQFEDVEDEGHAFCFIRNSKGNFMLYDHARNNFGKVRGNPIETVLNGEPLIIGEPFKNPGVYANACNLETNDECIN